MNVANYNTLVQNFHPKVVEAFNSLPEKVLREMDECVIVFILTLLVNQGSPDTYLAEQTVLDTLKLFVMEFGFTTNDDIAKKAAEKVVEMLEKSDYTKKATDKEIRLKAPMNIGKQYEDNVKKAVNFGFAKVSVNTNDSWTWDTKREQAIDDRRKRKEEEKKEILREEYEMFLRKRGVTNNQTIAKLHHKHEGAANAYTNDIRCNGIHIHMGKQVLLDDTDLVLLYGHTYGLVGRNGAGKTTLLRALSEHELEGVSPFVQILHVEQEIVGSQETPLQIILNTDVEHVNLLVKEQEYLKENTDESNEKLSKIYERLEQIDAHCAEARASEILHGLSFTTEMMTSPACRLSGGWRMRVALARALFVEPEVLLLDEPTNHLDLHAVLWLEQMLSTWTKTLVVVSHSRSFLNNVCSETIHLDHGKLTYYNGNYDQFEKTRCELMRQQQKQFEAQEKQRAHMQAFIDKFRYSASRAKMAQSRIKALERLESIASVMADPSCSLRFPEPQDTAPTPFIQIIDCEFGYKPGQTLFTDVNFSLDDTSRVVLCGANGSGKSTFMNLCLGLIEPRKGQVIRNQKVRIGHFAQHHLEVLTPQLSAVEFLRFKFPHFDDQQLRAHLGSMGLSGDKAIQPIYTLSGGQKSRVALTWITLTKPHLLLLDEPTNHLDIDTVNALLQALLEFPGGILVISHDENFINCLCDDIYICANGKVQEFNGDFSSYKQVVVKSMRR